MTRIGISQWIWNGFQGYRFYRYNAVLLGLSLCDKISLVSYKNLNVMSAIVPARFVEQGDAFDIQGEKHTRFETLNSPRTEPGGGSAPRSSRQRDAHRAALITKSSPPYTRWAGATSEP